MLPFKLDQMAVQRHAVFSCQIFRLSQSAIKITGCGDAFVRDNHGLRLARVANHAHNLPRFSPWSGVARDQAPSPRDERDLDEQDNDSAEPERELARLKEEHRDL